MIGCSAPATVSSLGLSEGRGGRGFCTCTSVGVGDAERTLGGYTGSRARVEVAWSGGGLSLKLDFRAATLGARLMVSAVSSSSPRTLSSMSRSLFHCA